MTSIYVKKDGLKEEVNTAIDEGVRKISGA